MIRRWFLFTCALLNGLGLVAGDCTPMCRGPSGIRGLAGEDGPPGPAGPAGAPGDCIFTVEILAQDGGVIDPTISYTELVWYDYADIPLWTLADASATGTEKYIANANDAVAPEQIQTSIGSFLLNGTHRKDNHLVFIDDVWKDLKYQYDYGTWFVDRQEGPRIPATLTSTFFGFAVALSADGNTLATTVVEGESVGVQVYVRTLPAGTWAAQGPFLVGAGQIFIGVSEPDVTLSADGNTLAYGISDDDSSTGATWVFVRTGTSWSQQAGPLVGAGGTPPGRQGFDVALDAAGNTLLVGAPDDDGGAGTAYVFVRAAGVWTQQPLGSPLTFVGLIGVCSAGFSVALSSDGNTAAVGAPLCGTGEGSVFIFTRTGVTWTQQGARIDYPGLGAAGSERFGYDVALSGDGNILVVGCPQCHISNVLVFGGAYTYARASDGTWSQLGPGLEPTNSFIGGAIGLSKDGHTQVLGYGKAFALNTPIIVYLRFVDVWAAQTALAPDATTTTFGSSVAIDADGRTVVTAGDGLAYPRALFVYT